MIQNLFPASELLQDISGRWHQTTQSQDDRRDLTNKNMDNKTLQDHLPQMKPLELGKATLPQDPLRRPLATTSMGVGEASEEPSSVKFPAYMPQSFRDHRTQASSMESEPQNKADAISYQAPSISIATSLTNSLTTNRQTRHARTSSNVTARLLQSTSPRVPSLAAPTPSTAKFAALRSPCFYHERFADAINFDRVLEEMDYENNGISTSHLMQTATSVREISKQLQRRPIKKPIRSIMIVTKARDNGLVYLTRELALWLLTTPRYGSDIGVDVYVDAKLKSSKRFDATGIVSQDPRFNTMLKYWHPDLCWSSPEKFDLVLTLGGDGTVLYTSFCLFQRVVPPVLAFSLGSLGFLTNFDFDHYRTSLTNIMGETGMRVNLRMRFTCTVFRARRTTTTHTQGRSSTKPTNPISSTLDMNEAEKFEVLNELVIDRGPSAYVSNLELYGDDQLLTLIQADGCIISTPTGSTAYALSAGGPLTHPSIPGMILAPICPHTLSFRPMVLSDTILLKIRVPRASRSSAYASFDGKNRVELRRGDCIQVEAGRYPFPTVVGECGTGGEWFESVRRALRWNTRGAVQKAFGSSLSSSPSKRRAGISGSSSLHNDALDETADGAEGDGDDAEGEEEDEEGDDEEEAWDIDPDEPGINTNILDSGMGTSVASSCASPRRQDSIGSPII